MKKVILLITVLFVSVISTACINNLAVQELNSKAKEYMAAGDVEKAICRLRSSIDLDTNIYETHYNLGVALIEVKDYKEAQKSLENAINLKPDFADSYYSLGLALQEQAFELANPEKKDDSVEQSDDVQDISSEYMDENAANVTDSDKTEIVEKLNSAIDNYNKYLSKKPDAQDKDKVSDQIEYLSKEIKKYSLDMDAQTGTETGSEHANSDEVIE